MVNFLYSEKVKNFVSKDVIWLNIRYYNYNSIF